MCNVQLTDELPSMQSRELENTVAILQGNNVRYCGVIMSYRRM